nr:hybrid sensor histidine kinase/response regulator [Desulfobulbaceae bacterium]
MDTPQESQQYENLIQIKKAGRRAAELVQQILSFSRQTDHDRQPIQLQFIVKEVLKLLRSSLPTTIDIHQNINTNCSSVLADNTQIHQVVMNLCTNAFHAMLNEKGTLSVQLEEVDIDQNFFSQVEDLSEGKYIQLTISDTGHGMSQDTLGCIFEPYF